MSTLRERNRELYYCWKAIKQRCNNPKAKAYCNYGGRGISCCAEWEKFEPFCEWALSNGWAKGLDIDRIDNDGDYSPENCRWISRRENVNNRRVTVLLTVNGVTKPSSVWADEIGASRSVLKKWRTERGKEYAEQQIAEVLENGYTQRNYAKGHCFEVKHIETGMVFRSISEAAAHFCISRGRLCVAMHKGGKTRKGTFAFTGTIS